MHFATLVHKINVHLLEFKKTAQVKTVLDIVFSEALVQRVIDFVTDTDYFAHFGFRLLEHFCLLERARDFILRSDVFFLAWGLLKTNDYETIVQILSFLSVALGPDNAASVLASAKMLPSIVRLFNSKQIEFVYHGLAIFEQVLLCKEAGAQRRTLVAEGVMETIEQIEMMMEFMTLPKLMGRARRVKKELKILQAVYAKDKK